jgi:hypothetical protein
VVFVDEAARPVEDRPHARQIDDVLRQSHHGVGVADGDVDLAAQRGHDALLRRLGDAEGRRGVECACDEEAVEQRRGVGARREAAADRVGSKVDVANRDGS